MGTSRSTRHRTVDAMQCDTRVAGIPRQSIELGKYRLASHSAAVELIPPVGNEVELARMLEVTTQGRLHSCRILKTPDWASNVSPRQINPTTWVVVNVGEGSTYIHQRVISLYRFCEWLTTFNFAQPSSSCAISLTFPPPPTSILGHYPQVTNQEWSLGQNNQ